MICPTCGSEVPDINAMCADCGKETKQLEQGGTVYCAQCGGKRKAKQRAKAARAKAKEHKAVKPKEDK